MSRTHGSCCEGPGTAATELVLTLSAGEMQAASSGQEEDGAAAGTFWGQTDK